MPANLKIWNPEAPQGAGRGAKRARPDDVEWHAVTMFEDGGEEWKSSDPAMEATREEVAHRMYVKKWMRNEPDARVWRGLENPGKIFGEVAQLKNEQRFRKTPRQRKGHRPR